MMMMMQGTAAALSACSPQQVGAGMLMSSVASSKAVSRKSATPLQQQRITLYRPQSRPLRSLRRRAQPTEEKSTETEDYVDYAGSKSSVFPDEDCEETGEGCNAEGVFKETGRSAQSAPATPKIQEEGPDREYEDYTGPKSVFPGEACDDLGGEYCDPEYQEGVHPDKVRAAKQ